MSPDSQSTPIYLESGKKRVFACALDWPGWCRSGKTEEQAIENLLAYGSRYAPVAAEAGFRDFGNRIHSLVVVERLPGNATTDFGAPDAKASRDYEPLSTEEAQRLAGLVAASWRILQRVVDAAPSELRKGPRGGGRDRDKVVEHVVRAEAAYARSLGLRVKAPEGEDRAALSAMRESILETLRDPSHGVERRWPAPYVARRIAWHALDHAWEIEDRGPRV